MQVENYFAQQPSGRHLLHVVPHRSAAAAPRAGIPPQPREPETRRAIGRAALGNLREAPSGRELLHEEGSEVSVPQGTGSPSGRGGRGDRVFHEVQLSPDGTSSLGGSSRWDDSDAHSGFPRTGSSAAYQITDAASAHRSSEAAESGMYRQASAVAPGPSALRDNPRGPGGGLGVRGLTESDFDISEGSESDSRQPYGSELTYEQDTAAGGSSVYETSHAGRGSGRPGSRVPRQQQQQQQREQERLLQQQGSSRSSFISDEGYSEYDAPSSSAGRHILGQDSWRLESPATLPSPDVPPSSSHGSSAASTEPSVLVRQRRQRFESPEDGDFGTVWLESRAHARRYDEQKES